LDIIGLVQLARHVYFSTQCAVAVYWPTSIFWPMAKPCMAHRYPLENDLILRPLAFVADTQYYVIVHALTLRREAGPFPTLTAATLAARDLAALRGVAVWHERLDRHGNLVDSPTLLFDGRI
jgi:hypothetical protein